jgi:hypothetical protein
MAAVLTKLLQRYGTPEERQVAQIIFDDTVEVSMGDQRLNLLAAHTYNAALCTNIFNMLEKAIEPTGSAAVITLLSVSVNYLLCNSQTHRILGVLYTRHC